MIKFEAHELVKKAFFCKIKFKEKKNEILFCH